MNEYTPSTEEVQSRYMRWSNEHERRFYPKEDIEEMVERCNAEFDRWLAEHDAEVAQAERERFVDLIPNVRMAWFLMGFSAGIWFTIIFGVWL